MSDNKTLTITVPANADLSTKQYQCVSLNSSGFAIAVTAITNTVWGILQNAPDESGKPAAICVAGVSNVVLGGTLATGALVGSGSTGKAVADATTNFTLGPLLKGGADTEIGEVLLNRMTVK